MQTHPNPPLHHRPAPRDGQPVQFPAKRKSSDERLYQNVLENVVKTAIAMIVMILVFQGIVKLMDSKKVPLLKVSQEAMEGDGQFTLPTEYGFVREAYRPDGAKMTQEELKSLAEQPEPKFNVEMVESNHPSQW